MRLSSKNRIYQGPVFAAPSEGSSEWELWLDAGSVSDTTSTATTAMRARYRLRALALPKPDSDGSVDGALPDGSYSLAEGHTVPTRCSASRSMWTSFAPHRFFANCSVLSLVQVLPVEYFQPGEQMRTPFPSVGTDVKLRRAQAATKFDLDRYFQRCDR